MQDTATPETGPVDAPASDNSLESVVAELEAGGGEAPVDALEAVTQELVNETESDGQADEAPETEDDATETEADEADPEEGTPDEQKYTVKVNGEELEVPLSELLNGYSRTEDYKQKTAAVAEQRREAEAKLANADAIARAEYANHLEEATNLFIQLDPVLAQARTTDWNALRQSDPAGYLQAQEAVQQRLNVIQQKNAEVAQHREQINQQTQQQAEARRAERFDKAADELVKQRPELADEAKLKAFASENVSFLRDSGFANEEIADVLDHRVLTLADDARQWRAHLAAQKSLPEKRVVQKSAVKPLKSDGTGSSAPKSRFPANASREAKGEWIVDQILNSE